jgi:hypothetical protein
MAGNGRRPWATLWTVGAVVVLLAFSGGDNSETTRVRETVRAANDYASPAALRDASFVVAVVEVTSEVFRGDIRETTPPPATRG